jgi:hypothetical protein
MPNRRLLAAIALIICVPLLFAWLGTGQGAGLAIGIMLVAVGLGSTLLGSRRSEDDT